MHRLIHTTALALAVLTTGCQITTGPTRASEPSQTPTWEDMNLGARVAPDGKPETCRWGFKAKAGTTTWEIDRNHTTCHVSGTKARRDYKGGNPYTGTWDYTQADGTVKQGEWEYGKKAGDWSWYTSTTTMKPGIQRGDGSSGSTTAGGPSGGAKPAKGGGSELCALAQSVIKPVDPNDSRWTDPLWKKRFTDFNRWLSEAVSKGTNYRDQSHCIKITDNPPGYDNIWSRESTCDYPIIWGTCIAKVGPLSQRSPRPYSYYDQDDPPNSNELCDSRNPKPTPDSGEFPEVMLLDPLQKPFPQGWLVDEHLYWAYTCEP